MNAVKIIGALLLSIAITACGYHLGGEPGKASGALSPVFKHVSLENLGKYDSLRHVLIPALRSYGIRVTRSEHASARIIIKDKQTRQHVVTVGDDAKASEYLLSMNVVFDVHTAGDDKRVLLNEQVIQASASYLYSTDQLLVSQNERRRALREIENSIARKLINRLMAVSSDERG